MVFAVYGGVLRLLDDIYIFVVTYDAFVVLVLMDLRVLRCYAAEIFGKFVTYICEFICGNPI